MRAVGSGSFSTLVLNVLKDVAAFYSLNLPGHPPLVLLRAAADAPLNNGIGLYSRLVP